MAAERWSKPQWTNLRGGCNSQKRKWVKSVLRTHSRTRLPKSPRNKDTANEELSTVTEYLTKLNDMCDAETERARQHSLPPSPEANIVHNFAMLKQSLESSDRLRTMEKITYHQESQHEPY